jgi:hypothetical protein
MIVATRNHFLFAVAGVFALAAVGCVSEDSTPAAPTRDASFAGYSNPDTKQTTCGNCHPDVQAEWAQTKHAGAWAGLQASGHADASCNKCHTTNGATNLGPDTAGFLSVSADAQRFYQDVQCESCHGPGANHISAPGEAQPIPTMLNPADHSDGCTSCHNGARQPFAEQLAASRHGLMPNWEGTAGTCQINCHNGFGAMIQIAPRARFRESVTTVSLTSAPSLTCAVCHEPHAVTNPGQTRMSLSTTDTARHVCGKCHNRNPKPTLSSSRGPHSAQAAVLLGTAGWVPSSFAGYTGPSRHGTQEGSCATCHMATGPVNTTAGAFAVQNTGHTFEVLPCLSATATTTGGVDTTAACTDALRDFSACATSSCHGTQNGARGAMRLLQAEIMRYDSTLWVDGDGDNEIDRAPIDAGYIPLVMARDTALATGLKQFLPCAATWTGTVMTTPGCTDSIVDAVVVYKWGSKRGLSADAVITAGEGARFNVLLAASPNQHGDGSKGLHNPGYMRGLMVQTIAVMRATYSYLPAPSAAVQAAMARDRRR